MKKVLPEYIRDLYSLYQCAVKYYNLITSGYNILMHVPVVPVIELNDIKHAAIHNTINTIVLISGGSIKTLNALRTFAALYVIRAIKNYSSDKK